MRVTFWGAAGEVTGSCYLVEDTDATILIDFGLFQGPHSSDAKNRELPPIFGERRPDAVFVTHAHLDHIGRMPLLARHGLTLPIYMTGPTFAIAKLLWLDSANLMGRSARRHGEHALYTKADVHRLMQMVKVVNYEDIIYIHGVKVSLHDAGHILGSSYIIVKGSRNLVFSGDLGNHPDALLRWTERLHAGLEYVVLESTYGSRVHEDSRERVTKLKAAINGIALNQGVLMIPTFAVDRAQELIFEIAELMRRRQIPKIPIFIDSPLAIKVTRIYQENTEYLNTYSKRLVAAGEQLFRSPYIIPTERMSESFAIDRVKPPKIIIAGSGMMHGGRIMRHAERYLDSPRNELLFIGYQAEGTLGRRLFDGEREVVLEHNKRVSVRARVKAIGAYSGHADQIQLLYWVRGLQRPPKRIFLTHGEPETQQALKKFLTLGIGAPITVPKLGESFEL